jgi:hypothetical protein
MKLLRVAIENRRWDLAAHTIVLATVSVLNNGNRPPPSKKFLNSPSSKADGTKKATKPRGKRA